MAKQTIKIRMDHKIRFSKRRQVPVNSSTYKMPSRRIKTLCKISKISTDLIRPSAQLQTPLRPLRRQTSSFKGDQKWLRILSTVQLQVQQVVPLQVLFFLGSVQFLAVLPVQDSVLPVVY